MEKKDINSSCYCKKPLFNKKFLRKYTYYEIVAIYPCEHLIHISCINFSWNYCPYCLTKISQYISYKQIKKKLFLKNKIKYYQIYVDISTIYNSAKLGKIYYGNLFKRIWSLSKLFFRFRSIADESDLIPFFQDFFDLTNIKLEIKNPEKLYPGKKIFISNHTTCFDPFFIYILTGCGFISNIHVLDKIGIRHILDLVPIILIKRGVKQNTVNRIKKLMKNINSVCLFPEGIITHPKTMARFRTGAFYTGYPVQPLIIKYNPNIYDRFDITCLLKLLSQDQLTISLEVLDIEFPDFTKDKINKIRNKMAMTGNFALSRISNKDILD